MKLAVKETAKVVFSEIRELVMKCVASDLQHYSRNDYEIPSRYSKTTAVRGLV